MAHVIVITLPDENFDSSTASLTQIGAGVCGGDAVVDECGVCEGTQMAHVM